MGLARIFRRAGRTALLLPLLFAAGCALQPVGPETPVLRRATLESFALIGRFSLRHEDRNYSGRLSWQHAGRDDTVLLSSPFGQGLAEIVSSEGEARLTSGDGRVLVAADSETLTRQALGYPLPLARLTGWVSASAPPGAEAEADARGRLRSLREDSWRIDYEYEGDDPQALPSFLIAERQGEFELRLRIDEWNGVTPGDRAP